MTSSLIKKLITYHNEAKAAIVTKTHEVEVALLANTPNVEVALLANTPNVEVPLLARTPDAEVALFANTPSTEMAIITEAEVALVINNHDIELETLAPSFMNEFRKHKASIGCDNAHLVELGRKNDVKGLESCFNKNTLIAVSLVANNKEIQTLVSDPRIEKLITVYQSLSEFKKTFSPISGLTAIANMLDLEKNNPGFVNNLSAQLSSQGCGASNLANSILTEALSLDKFSACLDSGTLIGVNLVSDMIE